MFQHKYKSWHIGCSLNSGERPPGLFDTFTGQLTLYALKANFVTALYACGKTTLLPCNAAVKKVVTLKSTGFSISCRGYVTYYYKYQCTVRYATYTYTAYEVDVRSIQYANFIKDSFGWFTVPYT